MCQLVTCFPSSWFAADQSIKAPASQTHMFINQPSTAFGDTLSEELSSVVAGQRKWSVFEYAVAWVNRPGAERILEKARMFLTSGGSIKGTVGLDFGNTSYEGLAVLLGLERAGADIATHVFHDKNRACTFHPKVFLFHNDDSARLFVGSNNMTAAGQATNIEAALSFSGTVEDLEVIAAREALRHWREDAAHGRALRLTSTLLDALLRLNYVKTEQQLQERSRSETTNPEIDDSMLFGRSPSIPVMSRSSSSGRRSSTAVAVQSEGAQVLLWRLRKRRNGNQVQFPIQVLNGSFVRSANSVVLMDGSRQPIGLNAARGRPGNTARFDVPGLRQMSNPVARLRWIEIDSSEANGDMALQMEVFDADADPEGAAIYKRLKDGITSPPVTNLRELSRDKTRLSKRSLEKAQWFRLDSASTGTASR